MFGQRRVNDSVHWYMSELSARVVAESGRPSDRFHLGKLILQGLKDEPGLILQIDGATGESETSGSVMERSIRCAEALKALGLQRGDVIVLMAPNHLDLCIPYYAALYLGVAIAPIDRTLGINELGQIFATDQPKVVFCQSEKTEDVQTVLQNCKIDSKVVTFDKTVEGSVYFGHLLTKYGSDTIVDDFKGSEFKFPHPTRLALLVSQLQWSTALLTLNLSPMLRYTRLQTSKDIDQEHAHYLINTYKPSFMLISPTLLATLLNSRKGKCDWTCFDYIVIAGGAVSKELLEAIQLIDVDNNGIDIVEPNQPGELWVKGPSVVKGYYKNPEADKAAFSEDGWFKTGDLMYRDENLNFFFIDRIKMLLKYKSHQVSPAEVQFVIAGHPGVLDVAVTGIPDYECGDLPVACVVRRPGCNVSAKEIKDLVKNNLADSKQLRGGVIFLDTLPLTAGSKVDNKKLKEIVLVADRE